MNRETEIIADAAAGCYVRRSESVEIAERGAKRITARQSGFAQTIQSAFIIRNPLSSASRKFFSMPNTIEQEFAEALSLQRSGNLVEAEQAWRDLIERYGTHAIAEHMLGLALHAQKRNAEALPWFERASVRGGNPVLWSNHAAALIALARVEEAITLCRRAVETNAQHFGAWLNLGIAHETARNFAESIPALETALRIRPGQALATLALARSQLQIGSPEAALRTLTSFAEGVDPELDLVRCEAWIESGDAASAQALLRRLAELDSVRARALALQARIAKHRYGDEARELLEQSLAFDPENADACARLAWLEVSRGETEAGLRRLHDWLERHPDDWNAANVYLFACQNSPRFDAAALLAEHHRLQPEPAAAPAWPEGWHRRGGKLRIGWLSAHPANGLLRTYFQSVYQETAARSEEIEQVFYALRDRAGNTEGDSVWANGCRFVGDLGDGALVERIRADGIDVLVDLVGRAKGNRLAVLAARVAPVQVAWFDAINPSGIEAMDYLVTDPRLSRPDADVHFSEKLLRLPYGRLAYSPPSIPTSEVEGASSRTFVSFNRFAKLNDEVVEVWARILHELPDWNLRLRAEGGGDPSLAAAFYARFGRHDIEPGRILIEEFGAYADAMQAYGNAAIALDPFPFSGCATTCDALWMGLPVVTLPGDTLASRQTASLLLALGRDDWIARDPHDYAARAIALAGDEPLRREWRCRARAIVEPALCDARRFSRELLEVLRSVAGDLGQR